MKSKASRDTSESWHQLLPHQRKRHPLSICKGNRESRPTSGSPGPRLERVTYSNDENGYTIGKVKVYGRRDLVTVVGDILNPTPGEILKMRGEWTNHPEFGEQFKVVFYKFAVPASVEGIEKYLGSGLSSERFRSIGSNSRLARRPVWV